MKGGARGVLRPLVKLAIFAVVTIALTSLLAQTLGSLGWVGGHRYRADFTDVTGLLAGDDVRIAGVKVGQVSDIKLVRTKTAEVTFSVDEEIPIPSTVQARIRYRNLIGQRYVELSQGAGSGHTLAANSVIPLSHTAPALDLTALFNGFQPLFEGLTPDDVNKFSYEIIQVLQGEGGTVNDLLARTASLTNTLADRDEVIGDVISNLNQVLAVLNARDDKLSDIISTLQDFVSGLAADRVTIGDSLSNIADLTNTTADLLTDARSPLRNDIAQLRALATTLNANTSVIESTLGRLPVRLTDLTRTASYGSWFNFYMCNFDGTVGVGALTVNAASLNSTDARCQTGGAQ
jgi:phospholipid/cholesterol/gamma-HCH transport system substrate-binding protein